MARSVFHAHDFLLAVQNMHLETSIDGVGPIWVLIGWNGSRAFPRCQLHGLWLAWWMFGIHIAGARVPLGAFLLTGSLLPPPLATHSPYISATPDITAMLARANYQQWLGLSTYLIEAINMLAWSQCSASPMLLCTTNYSRVIMQIITKVLKRLVFLNAATCVVCTYVRT